MNEIEIYLEDKQANEVEELISKLLSEENLKKYDHKGNKEDLIYFQEDFISIGHFNCTLRERLYEDFIRIIENKEYDCTTKEYEIKFLDIIDCRFEDIEEKTTVIEIPNTNRFIIGNY